MTTDNNTWLKITENIARRFIEGNYDREVALFNSFWQGFVFKLRELLKTEGTTSLTTDTAQTILAEVSFVRESSVDLVSPVVLPTVAVVIQEIQKKSFSQSELETLIGTTAAHFGAKAGLIASLVRSLPALCREVMAYNPDDQAALVSHTTATRYRIWTNGESMVVKSLNNYAELKNSCPFWLDLDAQRNPAPKTNKQILSPLSIKLLLYLVENLGQRKSVGQILADVYNDPVHKINDSYKDKIEQQITKLNKHSEGEFRKHLFAHWRSEGLGLQNTFRDKYFLFKRV